MFYHVKIACYQRTVTVKSRPLDHGWTLPMKPRVYYKTHETAFVGSSSDGLDDLMSPQITINLDRYNLVDGRSRLIVRASLKLILKHVL